jgi:curved DNA-binding protein CbpA
LFSIVGHFTAAMNNCGECCTSEDDFGPSGPQHNMLLSFPRMMGTPSSPMSAGQVDKNIPANPYQVLQIRRDATAMEIRQSFKRLALWYHPGRKQAVDITQQERRRRYQFFNLLATCYETLISADCRRRYDHICRELEQAKLQAGVRGAMFVGGKPLIGGATSYDLPQDLTSFSGSAFGQPASPFKERAGARGNETVPPLSRSSSGSSTADLDDGDLDENMSCCAPSSVSVGSPSRKAGISRIVTAATVTSNRSALARPSLVDSASSEDEEEAEAHFTESTTHRLFGGPLSHLFKARNFEPFSDPYDVFEKVFGSQPFQRISRAEIGFQDKNPWVGTKSKGGAVDPMSPGATRSPAAWKGESQTSRDGKTTVFTTSRVLHDRILTRTETITRVSPTKTKTHVTVTAVPTTPDQGTSLNDGEDMSPVNACMLCTRATPCSPSLEQAESPIVDAEGGGPICADFCELYQNCVHELEFTANGLFTEWNNMVSYAMPQNTNDLYR